MGVTKNIIVVEDRLRAVFDTLPPMIVDLVEYPIVFKYGDEKELMSFLKNTQGNDTPYPLIWLVYPYEEKHNRTHVSITDMSFVLAVETNEEMFNEERFETTYKDVLFPLYDNIRKLFNMANIITTNDTYKVIKFPNYSGEDGGSEEQKTVDIWDALKITFNCTINDWCLEPIEF